VRNLNMFKQVKWYIGSKTTTISVLIVVLQLIQHGNAMNYYSIQDIWNTGSGAMSYPLQFIPQLWARNPKIPTHRHNQNKTNSQGCTKTCRMSMACWMIGGRNVQGSCDNMFHICCASPEIKNYDLIQTNELTKIKNDSKLSNTMKEIQQTSVYNEPGCGRRRISRRRVVGGRSTGFGAYPWQAMIRIRDSRCGGALIGRRHVVTAGHCVKIHLSDSIDESPIRGVNVYLGEYSLYNSKEPLPRQRFSVDKIYVHPYYEFTPQADRYDIAVLKLSRPVRYDWHIGPICLPERGSDISVGSSAMVAGWGATEPDSIRRPRELQAVDVNVVDNKQCEEWHAMKGINIRIYDDMLCAGHEHGGKDACQGDSGGPLMTKLNQSSYDDLALGSKRRWTLVGLVSAGYSCAKPGQPGIYHRLSKSSDWISYVRMYL